MTVEEQERYRKIMLLRVKLHALSPGYKEYNDAVKELRELLGIKENADADGRCCVPMPRLR